MGNKTKSYTISVRKRASITKFKGQLYCHLSDQYSRKSVSFNYSELKKMKKILPTILETFKKHGKKDKKMCEASNEEEDGCFSPYNTTPESSETEE